jgi:hypothetical protein
MGRFRLFLIDAPVKSGIVEMGEKGWCTASSVWKMGYRFGGHLLQLWKQSQITIDKRLCGRDNMISFIVF